MSSTALSLLSAIETSSAGLAPQMRARLAALCGDAEAHARLLNALSLMEHIGSRKIMASQGDGALSQDTLKHLAEETRHAFFFKRAAERIGGREFDYAPDATMAGAAARFYMGRLDAGIAAALPGAAKTLPYLYMSLIVEIRAIWFYRLYQSVLAERRVTLPLASVIAEEERHLDAMLARIAVLDTEMDERLVRFTTFENARFRALWAAIDAAFTSTQLAAE